MKKLFILIIAVISSQFIIPLNAQDRIIKWNGDKLNCIVKEIGSFEIKYLLPDEHREIIHGIVKNEVKRIVFENGEVEEIEQELSSIITITGKEIVCAIKEISSDEIKYILPDEHNNLVHGIARNDVRKIVFMDGTEKVIQQELESMKFYAFQKKNAVKFGFMAPLVGYSTFSFERCLNPGKSFETGFSVIGLGKNIYTDIRDAGFSVRAGYKFIKSPDFYLKGMRYSHILKGNYVKLEPVFMVYHHKESGREYYWSSSYNDTDESSGWITKFAILVVLGKQWIFKDKFLVDSFWGIGYGISNEVDFCDVNPFYEVGVIPDFGLSSSLGFRIGLLYNTKKDKLLNKKS